MLMNAKNSECAKTENASTQKDPSSVFVTEDLMLMQEGKRVKVRVC